MADSSWVFKGKQSLEVFDAPPTSRSVNNKPVVDGDESKGHDRQRKDDDSRPKTIVRQKCQGPMLDHNVHPSTHLRNRHFAPKHEEARRKVAPFAEPFLAAFACSTKYDEDQMQCTALHP